MLKPAEIAHFLGFKLLSFAPQKGQSIGNLIDIFIFPLLILTLQFFLHFLHSGVSNDVGMAPNETHLMSFKTKWGTKYPADIKSWEDNWDILSTFLHIHRE